MKVAISCSGQTLADDLDPRFGRAACFLVVDTDTMSVTVIDNAARAASGGAGIAAAQSVIDQKIDAVITGQLGPNAMNVLRDADILMYQGISGSASSNIIAFKEKRLIPIISSRAPHAGMDLHGGRE